MTARRRGWFSLPRAERRAVLTMVWLVPALHVAVRVWDYRRTRGWIERRTAGIGPRPQPQPDRWRLATTRIQRYLPSCGNCLSRSLALWWMLRREGQSPDLRLGVSRSTGEFAAHAWVELDGRVLNDTPDVGQRFTVMEPPPVP